MARLWDYSACLLAYLGSFLYAKEPLRGSPACPFPWTYMFLALLLVQKNNLDGTSKWPHDAGKIGISKWPPDSELAKTSKWHPDPGAVGTSKCSPDPGAVGTFEWPPDLVQSAPTSGRQTRAASLSACMKGLCCIPFILIRNAKKRSCRHSSRNGGPKQQLRLRINVVRQPSSVIDSTKFSCSPAQWALDGILGLQQKAKTLKDKPAEERVGRRQHRLQ
jgi:hypothetical protein